MTLRSMLARIGAQEDLNFLLTNRIPRRLATRFMGWFSPIEQPLVRDASLFLWRLFCDVDLSDARTTRFRSLHDAFIRELKDGARPVASDPAVLTSPCDAIVGAHGRVEGGRVFQVKGFPYRLSDLLPDAETAAHYAGGTYVTLRLTAGMYHRFHAPHDCRVESVTYVAGDTWNVNPIALKRVEALFCKNERAVVRTTLLASGHRVTLVPVAAILVASLRFRFLDITLDLRRKGPRTLPCDAELRKGEEMGWFQHGSTIIVLAPEGFGLCEGLREGGRIRMGEPLMRLPQGDAPEGSIRSD
ncbi:archaetidylserine decarboxylase [Methylobacterium isbiliense]|nr:archaetidylserine decarboxylase [Methylobacterium isbiliense]MDN3624017.1 archaetidylserine decarboxylase [Methylobacterium isbiliense]